jgi:hypothetical protein
MQRLESAKIMISSEDSIKRPHLLGANKEGKRPYMLALQQYEECRDRLKQVTPDLNIETVTKNKKVSSFFFNFFFNLKFRFCDNFINMSLLFFLKKKS